MGLVIGLTAVCITIGMLADRPRPRIYVLLAIAITVAALIKFVTF